MDSRLGMIGDGSCGNGEWGLSESLDGFCCWWKCLWYCVIFVYLIFLHWWNLCWWNCWWYFWYVPIICLSNKCFIGQFVSSVVDGNAPKILVIVVGLSLSDIVTIPTMVSMYIYKVFLRTEEPPPNIAKQFLGSWMNINWSKIRGLN